MSCENQDQTKSPANCKKRVLILFPSDTLLQILENYSQGRYEFYGISDPKVPNQYSFGTGNDPNFEVGFDPHEFIERAVKYVKDHDIDGLFFTNDYAGLLAAVISERTGLHGSSVESQLLCVHKYYSRKAEPSKLWFDAIDLDKDDNDWRHRIHYPCYLKPPCMFRTICQFVVRNEQQMEDALRICRRVLPPWSTLFRPIFEKYVDVEKYPLALKNMMLVEELVPDGTEHVVEGWADDQGEPYVWLTSDESYFMKPEKTVDGYFMPSQLPKSSIEAMEKEALRVARNHGLRNTFFNVEVWCRDKGKSIVVTEINNRVAGIYHDIYYHIYNTSCYFGALHLACGEYDKLAAIHPLRLPAPNKVGALYYIHIHPHGEHKATEVIDYQKGEEIQKEAVKDGDVIGCYGKPGMTVTVKEDAIIRPIGSTGCLAAAFSIIKPSLKEVIDKMDDIRFRLFKDHSMLPYEREEEYYELALGH